MDLLSLRDGMNAAVPYNKHLGLELLDVRPGAATVRLPDADHLKNHVGSQHAGALFSAAEAASGGAVVGAFAEQLGGLRLLVRDASIAYSRVARGSILAVAQVDGGVDEVQAALDRDGRADFRVVVVLTDAEEQPVAEMAVRWNLKVLEREGAAA